MMIQRSHSELSAQWMRDIAKAKADPVFAAIEHWRPLWAAFMASCAIEDGEACDASTSKTIGPAYASLRAIYKTEPTTAAGLLAMMTIMLEIDGDHLNLTSPQDAMDDGERGLIAVFHYARRLLGDDR